MQSKVRPRAVVNRDGIAGTRGNSIRDQDVSLVEMDATFARTLGISDGQKVTASLHLDFPEAHTVSIEPLTPDDWEMIELHATFLEINLLQQIRALPNPTYKSASGTAQLPHPLTLHLSPTSTANVVITSLSPPPSSNQAFAKLSPDAEVIVAPKERAKPLRPSAESRSVTSRRSAGARSGGSAVRRKSGREESRPALFFRALDRSICAGWFESEADNQSLKVWVDRDLLLSKTLKGVTWVTVTVLRPATLQAPIDPQKQQQELEAAATAGKVSTKVVARLMAWDDPPDSQHVALSSALCASLSCAGIVGGVVKIEQASAPTTSKSAQAIKIFPFAAGPKSSEGLKFGGETKAEREEAAKRILKMYGKQKTTPGFLDGPITNGSHIGLLATEGSSGWQGGIIRFDVESTDSGKQKCDWFLGSDRQLTIEVQAPIPKPLSVQNISIGEPLPAQPPILVGIDNLLAQLQSHLSHMSSVLLTGGLGSGKSSVARLLAFQLQSEKLFHTTYFSCRKLVTDETRVSTIKETFTRIFMGASWGARLGGKSIVVLDDLDKLCPVETELEVGGANGRSRQISESVCAVVKQYCTRDSGVVLLTTAQAKESLHNVIVGGHVVREIISLKAPNKEGRRRIMEMLVKQSASEEPLPETSQDGSRPGTASGPSEDEGEGGWMTGPSPVKPSKALTHRVNGTSPTSALDFLDLAGSTDGYMPADLHLLVSRARSESLIRSVSTPSEPSYLTPIDFTVALKGFTPASLRNVTLQTSTTTFSSIGGLHETRKILLETLQYPTLYAPIFAQCPLRLRSGILLYGYPGCGKTMLASAVAGECGLNFISVKGPEILNKYIGASEKSVRDLFERAEAARPCVLFFDEFESVATKRGHDSTGVTDRVVNQLLTLMDGAEGLSGVYVLAATSRPDLIDPALLRPGRLDKSLLCDLPSLSDREDILLALSKKLHLGDEVLENLNEIASRTEGYSGADLQALVYNAHLEAIHDVLGDQDPTTAHSSNNKRTNGVNGTSAGAGGAKFTQFLYGIDEDRLASQERSKSGHNASQAFTERAAIVQKLSEIKANQKRAKLLKRGLGLSSNSVGNGGDNDVAGDGEGREEKEKQDVIIGWKHIRKALGETRASISAQEKRRLGGIYREFVDGRDGNMKDGEGGREIGGRTSLM